MGSPGIPQAPNLTLTNPWANVQPPHVNENVGQTGSHGQIAQGISAALQGLRYGYAMQQTRKYDQMQNAYQVARYHYDQASRGLSGIDKTKDPQGWAVANQAVQAATQELQQTTNSLIQFTTGGGGKGKSGGGGQTSKSQSGQPSQHENIIGKLAQLLTAPFHHGTAQPPRATPGAPPPTAPGTPPTFPTAPDMTTSGI